MFFEEVYRYMMPKLKPTPKIRHRQTCPDCGQKRVNLYYSELTKKYHCKDCLNQEGE